MKRSLAPPRRDKPTGGNPSTLPTSTKKNPTKFPQDRGPSLQKPPMTQNQLQSPVHATQKFQQRYRNKNLNLLPTPLLVALSALSTLDISYNKLTDSQIELIMNSCAKLSTLCIQGNLTNLIPMSIGKLKLLVNFRHDWVKLTPQNMYQPSYRMQKIKQAVKKPDMMVKVNRIVGLDFMGYCSEVLQMSIDRNLLQKIDKSDCTPHAKQNMLKYVDQVSKGKLKSKQKMTTIHQAQQRSLVPGCFGLFSEPQQIARKQQKWRQLPHKKQPPTKQQQSEAETDAPSTNIKIEDIRDIAQPMSKSHEPSLILTYSNPQMPLHHLFANFEVYPHAAAEIDGLLLRGYNPNQYDSNGLSAYHLCVIHRQKKGLQYLLQICSKNPGFFDLQMPSIAQGRNILHYSIFMKNYLFTMQLIQFGLPIDKRDASGARLTHLVDQNYQFLILLRKLLRRRTSMSRSLNTLAIPHLPVQNRKYYVKHPQRQKQQARFRITYSRNDGLLDMYEAATGCGKL